MKQRAWLLAQHPCEGFIFAWVLLDMRVNRKAHFAGVSRTAKRCDAADNGLMTYPEGTHQMRHACVAKLANETTIDRALRPGLTHLVCTCATFVEKGQGEAY